MEQVITNGKWKLIYIPDALDRHFMTGGRYELYDLWNDPQEKNNVLFPHTWVPKAALPQLQKHIASLKKNPPIPTGAADPYHPQK